MRNEHRPLSWKPIRRGGIYCAPACGYGCTWKAYQKAKKDARQLAKSLGHGWTVRVWENLGWHYCVNSPCGRIKVHSGNSWFTAFLGESCSPGGKWAEHGRTAKIAIRNVVAAAKRDLKKINAYIRGL